MRYIHSILLVCVTICFSALTTTSQEINSATETWDKIHEVLSHPRCANCHVGDDHIPRWSGPSYEKAYGLEPGGSMLHGMNVQGDESRIGVMTMPCSTCHQESNLNIEHAPPGAHAWALAPVEMVWFNKSSAEICARLKSRETNGNRSLEEVAAHIDNDALVHWGWDPGPGREPAPYDRKQTAAMIRTWAEAGAPCPDGRSEVIEYLNRADKAQ